MKVYIQIIDTNTGVYQTGMIDEPILHNKHIENALAHFGVTYAHINWHNNTPLSNAESSFGEIEGTSKIVAVVTLT